jgi:hypothetical protein
LSRGPSERTARRLELAQGRPIVTDDLPESVTLEWLGRMFLVFQREQRAMRSDMDMLVRMVVRMDHSLDAMREDLRALWLNQGDLRRRIEALEEARKS